MAQTLLTFAEVEANDPEGGKRRLCPLPACVNHQNKKSHRSLDIGENGIFYCHRCKASGQFKEFWAARTPAERQARQRERKTQERARLSTALVRLAVTLGTAPALAGAITPPSALEGQDKPLSASSGLSGGLAGNQATVSQDEKVWRYRLGSLQPASAAAVYLATRGFSGERLQVFADSGAKFSPDFARSAQPLEQDGDGAVPWKGKPAIVFPLRDEDGELVAAQGRFIEKGDLRMLTFDGERGRKSGVFWSGGALAAWQEERTLVVVEAPIDALSLATAGIPAVALCGSCGLPDFFYLGAFGRRFVLAFDNDDNKAGDLAAEALGSALSARGGIVFRVRPDLAKDWNELLQKGGSDWARQAEALRAIVAREVKASPVTEEPLEATIVDNVHNREPEPSFHERVFLEGGLYPDKRQEVLTWAMGEVKKGTFPEPSDTLVLPSCQRVAAGGASVWLQGAQKIAEGLYFMGARFPDAEEAFYRLRRDMRYLACWGADARIWLNAPADRRGAFCTLPWARDAINAKLKALAAEFEDEIPDVPDIEEE